MKFNNFLTLTHFNKLIIYFTLAFVSILCSAQQKQGSNWVLGPLSVRIDFNHYPPKVDTTLPALPTNTIAPTVAGSLSDSTGNLLFFIRGTSTILFNKNGVNMANSGSYVPQNIMTEIPQKPGKYFLLGSALGANNIPIVRSEYLIVDMALDSGLGQVIQPPVLPATFPKGVVLDSIGAGGRSMLMLHANGIDFWIVVPIVLSDSDTVIRWHSYLLDSSGIPQGPIVSEAGGRLPSIITRVVTRSAPNSEYFLMQPQYNNWAPRLVSPTPPRPLVPYTLFRFNRLTGEVGNEIARFGVNATDTTALIRLVSIGDKDWSDIGFVFSPSSRYLYLGTEEEDIYQFDVSLPPNQIYGSKTKVSQGMLGQRDMQIGTDGKIYIIENRFTPSIVGNNINSVLANTAALPHYLSVINCPDQPGLACNVQDSVINLLNRSPLWMLPMVNSTLLRNTAILQTEALRDTICIGDSANLSAYGAGASSFLWSVMTPQGSGGGLAATTGSPVRAAPTATSLYRVIGFKTCELPDTAYVQLTVVQPPLAQAGPDTALCARDSVRLGVASPVLTNRFRWLPLPSTLGYLSPLSALSSTSAQRPVFSYADTLSVVNTFRYVLEVFNGGCRAYDTVAITVYPLPIAAGLAGADRSVCPHEFTVLGDSSLGTSGLSVLWSAPNGVGISYLDSAAVFNPTFSQGTGWTPVSSFVYVLQVTDSLGCQNTDSVAVQVLPVPALPVIPDSIFCSGDTLVLSVDTVLFPLSFTWAVSSGPGSLTASSGAVAGITGFNASYADIPLSLVLQGADSLCFNRDTLSMRISALPDTILFGSKALCPNATGVPYLPSGSAVSASFWSVVGGVVATGTSLDTLRVNWGPADSTAFIRWQPVNALGCLGDTVQTPILIRKELPTETPLGDTILCALPLGSGSLIRSYTLPANPTSTYTWQVLGANLISGQGGPVAQLAFADTFSAPVFVRIVVLENSVTATDTCFGTSDTLLVRVNPAPASRVLQLDGSRCANDTLQAVLLPPAFGINSTYLWSLGVGSQGAFIGNPVGLLLRDTVSIRLFPGTAASQISLRVQERNGFGCLGPLMDTVLTVLPQPVAAAGPDRQLCHADSVVLGAAAVGGVSYLWSPVVGLSNSAVAQPVFTGSNLSGSVLALDYVLGVTSAAGCRNVDSVRITVLPAPDSAIRIVGDTLRCAGTSGLYALSPTPASVNWSVAPSGIGLNLINAGNNTVVGLASVAAQQVAVQVQAVAFTAQGCTSDTLRLSVQLYPKPRPLLSTDSIACEGEQVFQAAVTNPGSGSSFFWSMQQGQVLLGQGTPNVQIGLNRPFGNNGSRSLRLVETSVQGCISDTLLKTLYLDGSAAEIIRASTLIENENQVEVVYRINNPALVLQQSSNFFLERSTNLNPWQVVFSDSMAANRFVEPKPDSYPASAVAYRLRYNDACGVERWSAVHNLIQLRGSVSEDPIVQGTNGYSPARSTLEWNAYAGWSTEQSDIYRTTTARLPQPPQDLYRARVNPPWEEANGSDAFVQTYRIKASTEDETNSLRYSWSNSLSLRYDNPLKFFNVVTPNGDGQNETFIIANVQLYEHRLTLLDRWGRTVLQTEQYNNDWSTRTAGTYFYRLENKTNGEQYSGWVQVLE